MDVIQQIYQRNIKLLNQLNIAFNEWQHRPILDVTTDEAVAKEFGWTGTLSKSLFLKVKGGGYALYLTDKDSRLNAKGIKGILGKRVSICDNQEMTAATGCLAGAVCPFTLPSSVPIIWDASLREHDELLYTPGDPAVTIGFHVLHLEKLLAFIENPIFTLAK
ncbi:YbaK/EbsC family protein [Vibrio sp. S9_S30]|uniref:YbaK/EbsC family protein n=1 Tax=Vibrio sp. S9_S30 TaxID=2720226 RepID=UPI00168169CA|nr:YbaK/EbsC family protein [Vibrio sp. S9_S30]MBD1559827.1 YbaK/EbsC family protein [Vibrio sp. S9_S30]